MSNVKNYFAQSTDGNNKLTIDGSFEFTSNSTFINNNPSLQFQTSNYSATTNPSVTNDTTEGYSIGSFWYNSTQARSFVCIDATEDSAVWKYVSGDSVNVKDFGAVGDGVTDDTAAIQAAENAATDFGVPTELFFPNGIYATSASISKKANSHWRGTGRIKRIDNAAPTGAAFALVVANGVDNWSMSGVHFENVDWATELSVPLTRSIALGNYSACLDIFNCNYFDIKNITCRKFSHGILYRECNYFNIKFNSVIAQTGKTVNEIIAGTYTPFSTSQNTLGIGSLYNASGLSSPSKYFTIQDNYVEIPGLDAGIFVLSQTYDKSPSVITGNIIRGANAGIQVYRGSFVDTGSAPTYNTGIIISNNSIYGTIEQGIYFRGSVGCQIISNYIERAAQGGANGATSAASICLRVNPFDSSVAATFVSAAAGDVSDDHAVVCIGNRVVSHGVDDAACDSAILCEINNAIVINNTITRPAEEYTTGRGNAILFGNGKGASKLIVEGNVIEGMWTIGISGSSTDRSSSLNDLHLIKNNKLYGTYTIGAVSIDTNGFNGHIEDNIIQVSSSTPFGINIRQTVFNKIINNTISGAVIGINIAGGTDLGSCAHYLSGGTVSKSIRRGSSNVVKGNKVFGATTAFSRSETNGDDSSFYGRCSEFSENYVNGVKITQSFSGGTPESTFTTKTHIQGDFILNSAIASAASPGKYCITSGQYGSTATATGDTTNGSPIITSVSSLDGLGVGVFISLTGFSGTVQIISIDTDNDAVTVNINADSNNTGVTISSVIPIFAAAPVLT